MKIEKSIVMEKMKRKRQKKEVKNDLKVIY